MTGFSSDAAPRPLKFQTQELLAEPGILEAPAIEQAVDHDCDPVHRPRSAGPQTAVEDQRPRRVLLQPAGCLRGRLLAFCLVALDRLLLVHLAELWVALGCGVSLRSAS